MCYVFEEVYIFLSRSIFTSMFVERMEVLEYRQKFKVELSAFPDYLHWNAKKTVF